MSKILFTWELGEGTGHIMPYVELISRLVEQGHEVHFALRSLHKAYDIFHDSGVIWHQAPLVLPRHVKVIMPIDSFAKILYHAGHDTPNRLAGLLSTWHNLYSLIDPDLIVFDYSPTAMLAARNGRAKTIAIGTGFHLPHEIQPLRNPGSASEAPDDLDEKIAFSNRVFETINTALERTGMEPLARFDELLQADEIILRTLPEMDHDAGRVNGNYGGIMKSPPGELPQWPQHPGPKIFAYLKSFKTLPKLLETLNRRCYPTLIYGDKVPEEVMQRFSSDTLKFCDKPLDMDAVGQSADLAICNAGHGSTTELLLSGVPLLLLPLNGEQCLVANNVERIGAGLSAPQLHPGGMEHKLETILREDSYRESAQRFAESYRDSDITSLTDSVLKTINSQLSENTAH